MIRKCFTVSLLLLTLSSAAFAAGDELWVSLSKKAQMAALQQRFSEAEGFYNQP